MKHEKYFNSETEAISWLSNEKQMVYPFVGQYDESIIYVETSEENPYAPKTPPNDEIWYTTSNNIIMNNIDKNQFSGVSTIMSHTYEDGKGIIKFNTNVTGINENENSTFNRRENLTSISFPNSFININNTQSDGLLYQCTALKKVTFGNAVTSIGSRTCYECSALESITIPNSVTSIGSSAFQSCTSLTSATIGNAVISIEEEAFSGCSALESIEIPNSVTSISNYAFSSCSALSSATLGNGLTSIGNGAFSGCSALESINIPSSVTSIVYNPFIGSSKLKSIIVDSGNTVYDSRNNCNAIIETSSNKLITGCNNTIIPDSVTSIGPNAFYGCSSLTSINIPSSLTSIGGSAFAACTALASIEIPDSITSIGPNAFGGCKSLSSIEIPNSVTRIESGICWHCSSLKTITIGTGVTFIDSVAFSDCTSLESFTIKTTTPPTLNNPNVFNNTNNCPIYVPSGSVSAYKAANFWSQFVSRIQAISE